MPQFRIHQRPRLQLGNAPLVGFNGSQFDQAEVLWQTMPAGTGGQDVFKVNFRPVGTTTWSPGGSIQQLSQSDGRIVFSSRMTGLQYDAAYEYRVQHWSDQKLLQVFSSPFQTRLAAGSTKPFSFVAYGDSGYAPTIDQFRSVQARINSLDQVSPLAFSMLLGDNSYGSAGYRSGSHAALDTRFVSSLTPEASLWNSSHIDYAAYGNHDIYTEAGAPTEASFSSPIPVAGSTSVASAPAGERPEHTFSFDYGNVHIASFDSNSLNDSTRLNNQLTWLEADMAASRAQWKIVVLHHPVAGSPDKSESPAGNYYQQVVPRLRAANVDLLLSGHSHTYHQSYPLLGHSNGVATFVLDQDGVYDKGAGLIQLVVGTGGVPLSPGSFSDKPYIRAGFSSSTTVLAEPGFSRIDVTPDNLIVRYIAADDGAILSSFTIQSTITTLQPVTLNVAPTTVTEDGAANLIYTFSRTGATNNPLTVNYTVGGTAILGSDYTGITATGTTKTITFAAGSAKATVTVNPIANFTREANESVALTLASGSHYIRGTTTAVTGTILNDDLIGTANADILIGKAIAEFFDGLAGQDTFTGASGLDVFGFRFGQSSIPTPDRITDFRFGTNKVDLFQATGAALSPPAALSRAANNSTASTLNQLATAVFSDANGALSGNQNLAANAAALVVATHPQIFGTYLIVNDATVASSTTNDLMINITGYSGTLPLLGTVSIGSMFL